MDKADIIKEIRKSTGMNRKEFCEFFHIPYRTVTEWERGVRHAPDYVVRLLGYYIRVQNMVRIKKGGRGKMKETDNIEIKDADKIKDDMTEKYTSDYGEGISIVAEDAGIYDATGGSSAFDMSEYDNKTVEDYLNLPEGERVELIDGIFYDMAAPSIKHQWISFDLAYYFRNFIDKNNGSCIPLVSPVDVQLDCDDRTMVQPDVIVLCDRDKLTKERIIGAPDLIVEVVSPSNWYNDTTRKLLKYKNAGAREYWIVMPENLKVLVYFFEKSDLPVEYSFKDEVPVNIWNGKCKIDFRMIYEKIKDMP